jgi:diguanylate cyclase (GGDEF)-like protein
MKRSIKKKFALLIFLTTALVSTCLIAVSTIVVRQLADTMYKESADSASYVAAANVDPKEVRIIRDKVLEIYSGSDKITSFEWGSEAFNKYQALYESIYDTQEYKNVLRDLKVVQDGSNVSCIYIIYPKLSDERNDFIYLVDADPQEPCPIGCIDSYDWADDWAAEISKDPEAGMDPAITNTEEYGWLVSNLRPIKDDNNEIVAYACTDVSMNEIRSTQNKFTAALIAMAIVILAVIYFISTYILNQTIVKPIKELSETAENYWADGKSGVRNDFAKLTIDSADEIGVLTESMKKMESDINNYIVGLVTTKQELGAVREESEAIREMASKDSLTGVRNKNAYNTEIEEVTKACDEGTLDSYGLAMIDLNFLKVINDTYGHEKGDISIQTISDIVCEVFDHSPVFRVGGDEFVVILIKNDLVIIDSLVAKFKEKMSECEKNEALEPWKRVSAAIGYAVYEKGVDTTADDVFERADANMYADKVAHKAQRK